VSTLFIKNCSTNCTQKQKMRKRTASAVLFS